MEEMDRKDVGILAMDIYFPPSCVQQVKFFSPTPNCARYCCFCSAVTSASAAGQLDSDLMLPIRVSGTFPIGTLQCGGDGA